MTLVMSAIVPSNTSYFACTKMATSTSTLSGYTKINVNTDNGWNSPRYIISRSNEANTAATSASMDASRSAEFKIWLDGGLGKNILGSPAIDLKRVSLVLTHNLINSTSDVGTSEQNAASGGNAKARYITRTVTLADGQDAEDLRVYITAYKPSGSDIKVYYKLLHREDSDAFAAAKWRAMELNTSEGFSSDLSVSSSENKNDIIEFVYDVPDYTDAATGGANTSNQSIVEYRNSQGASFQGYKYFAVKIVLVNSTSSNPPRVKDFRAIALQI